MKDKKTDRVKTDRGVKRCPDGYEPKLSDPRVLRRVKLAYGFARAYLSPHNSSQQSKSQLDKFFGQPNSELSFWLRDRLLICLDHHYIMGEGKTKEYCLNRRGADHIRRLLNNQPTKFEPAATENEVIRLNAIAPVIETEYDQQVAVEFVRREYSTDLLNLSFEYSDKSSRWWHPLQNVRSLIRGQVLSGAGLTWDYDIVACAPTLIHQHAQSLGMDEYLFGISDFLRDRTGFREHVARVAGIEISQAKVIINSLFCGAKLGANKRFALFRLLNSYSAVQALRTDKRLIALIQDIRTCWRAIAPTMSRSRSAKGRLLPITSRERWARYFELERQVMRSVRTHVIGPHFLIHDGFATRDQQDTATLIEAVKQDTGFTVSFSEQELNPSPFTS